MSRSRQPRMTRLLRADGATVLSNLLDPSRRRISTAVSARIFAKSNESLRKSLTQRKCDASSSFWTDILHSVRLRAPTFTPRGTAAAFRPPSRALPPSWPSETHHQPLLPPPGTHFHKLRTSTRHRTRAATFPFSYFSHRTSYDSKHLVPRLTHVSYQTVNTYKTKGVFSGLTGWSRDAPPPFK